MALSQEQIEGLSIKAVPRSCGTQINGKHFGVKYVKLQKKDPVTKKPMVKEIDGKEYPVFVEKRDPETGDIMYDNDGKVIYCTEAVPDELKNVTNETFIWAITNKKAVSSCDYDVRFDTATKGFYIYNKKQKKAE